MMVMTAKVDLKKILLFLAAVGVGILGLLWLLGSRDAAQTAAPGVSANDGRVRFLEELGWDVTPTPLEAGQVRIPETAGKMFDRYNALQKSQGYDLSSYAGKKVMRYVYRVNNLPNATDKVYATLLVYKDQVIGGDVTDTSGKGKMMSFKASPGAVPKTEATVGS